MKAIGYQNAGAIDRADSLVDNNLPRPSSQGSDLLVQVRAISVNPVGTKVRKRVSLDGGQWTVLGWDAVGEVVETGPEVRGFRKGDAV